MTKKEILKKLDKSRGNIAKVNYYLYLLRTLEKKEKSK